MRYLSNLLLGVLLVVPAFMWADDPNENILLIFGDWNTGRESGDVVVTVNGVVKGDGVFPAVSSDHQQVAILHVDDWHDRSVVLRIMGLESRDVINQFDLVLADERGEALNVNLNADDRDAALTSFEDKIRNNLKFANQYLSQNKFRPIQGFYNFRPTLHEGPRILNAEFDSWEITYDRYDEVLEISSVDTGDVALRIKQPIEVHGMAHPGTLCRVRPTPYQGWYDQESDTVVIRLGYFHGSHGCDLSDKWLIERLGSS